MKYKLLFTALLCNAFFLLRAQGTWTQKANVGTAQRRGAVTFTIGTKAYILGGHNNSSILTDLLEWDQNTNTWTQKASFPGTPVYFGSGFSIGNKGYIGVGFDGTQSRQDFWEWDQNTNTWSKKANFPGVARNHAVGFSIGTKGYITTGVDDNALLLQDFWEWDQNTNTWTQGSNFGGTGRQGAACFCIGTKVYIGTGQDYFTPYCCSHYTQDLWEWDQNTNIWVQKANFGGDVRYHASAFSIGTKGYIGLGLDTTGNRMFHDLWEWDQSLNTWSQKASPPFGGRWLAAGLSVGTKGYLGIGGDSTFNMNIDFWEYSPAATNPVDQFMLENSVTIYPNPGKGVFTCIVPDVKNKTCLEIYNTLGEKVRHIILTEDKTEIDLKEKKGIYFCRIISDNKLISKKRLMIE